MQAVLVMFRSDGERRSFSITRDMTVVGRREDCDLRIPLGEISRKHCRLVRDGESLRLEDLGSSNGTYLNGQRVQEAALNAGDSVQVGPVVFVLQIDGYPGDDDLQPVTADADEQAAAIPAGGDNGPLTPTAQSEVDDLGGGLEPLPEHAGEEADEFAVLEESEARAEAGGEVLDFDSPGHQPHA
ncbi:MAG: domain containing protein [Phycisphaerales bacterium]|nr:domain containing protein [Phycisphaerales bacterium]MDB5303084.1 domain containing protein [Phycisphaerales bacterium]